MHRKFFIAFCTRCLFLSFSLFPFFSSLPRAPSTIILLDFIQNFEVGSFSFIHSLYPAVFFSFSPFKSLFFLAILGWYLSFYSTLGRMFVQNVSCLVCCVSLCGVLLLLWPAYIILLSVAVAVWVGVGRCVYCVPCVKCTQRNLMLKINKWAHTFAEDDIQSGRPPSKRMPQFYLQKSEI